MVNILLIISPYLYSSKIFETMEELKETDSSIFYVSLNKTYKSLIEDFRKSKLDLGKIIFLDAISSTVIEPKPVDNCVFVSSPDNLKEIYSKIIATVKSRKVDFLIFDSLSSLTTYQDFGSLLNFVTTLLASLSLLNCSAIFTSLKTDEDTPLIQHVKMKVDKSYEQS